MTGFSAANLAETLVALGYLVWLGAYFYSKERKRKAALLDHINAERRQLQYDIQKHLAQRQAISFVDDDDAPYGHSLTLVAPRKDKPVTH